MAFHTRKTGWELWRKAEFKTYGFCLCCKGECAPGEIGYESIKLHMDMNRQKLIRSFLCNECSDEWKEKAGQICKLSRFKLE